MTPLPTISGKVLVAALERAGYQVTYQRGSHVYLRKLGSNRVTVPVHGNRDLPPGTLRAILRRAGISVDELVDLLRG